MGDISRHRDIFLNSQQALPRALLDKCGIAGELTYVELGNFLTDVSQFRDPVSYIFAKQRVWREKILGKIGENAGLAALKVLTSLAAVAGTAALAQTRQGALAAAPLALLPIAGVADELVASLLGLNGWIDAMFGNPIERTRTQASRRKDTEYGYVGQFFQHFIEGITQLLFAREVQHQASGPWGQVPRIPEANLSAVFQEFFTQYYPHEHTDQPPFVWDASERPQHPTWYGASRRQQGLTRTGGVMNAVDKHYIQYLSEGLTQLEHEFRSIRSHEAEKRRSWLVRLGKILHGVEDWFFHSNVVELLHLRSFQPERGAGEDADAFLRRFVLAAMKDSDPAQRLELERRLYRRLRFAVYERGTNRQSTGVPSTRTSTPSLDHAYPAFPSQQDTTHTLLAALENLEQKGEDAVGRGYGGGLDRLPPWLPCVLGKFTERSHDARKVVEEKAKARGLRVEDVLAPTRSENARAVMIDVMRELLPLVLTLLYESERQRLVADVPPLEWPTSGPKPSGPKNRARGSTELDEQVERHKRALEPRTDTEGRKENNYQRAARYVSECGFLNERGRQALFQAFEVDQKSQKLNARAPGAGGFLLQFAVELQQALDAGDQATERLNQKPSSRFDPATDNGAFGETIGSHSLMSKDTKSSLPFFDDARVLASVASLSVFQMLLEEASTPPSDKGIDWQQVLWHFIRFPSPTGGWERRALAFFKQNDRIPAYADLPELAQLAKAARLTRDALERRRKGTKARDLEQEYIELEKRVSHYRFPQ
jgi:hypothetical protein